MALGLVAMLAVIVYVYRTSAAEANEKKMDAYIAKVASDVAGAAGGGVLLPSKKDRRLNGPRHPGIMSFVAFGELEPKGAGGDARATVIVSTPAGTKRMTLAGAGGITERGLEGEYAGRVYDGRAGGGKSFDGAFALGDGAVGADINTYTDVGSPLGSSAVTMQEKNDSLNLRFTNSPEKGAPKEVQFQLGADSGKIWGNYDAISGGKQKGAATRPKARPSGLNEVDSHVGLSM